MKVSERKFVDKNQDTLDFATKCVALCDSQVKQMALKSPA
jgi:hypothetical protein